MAIQLIFCVETVKTNGSDWIYIHDIIDHFYKSSPDTKLTTIYMKGKWNLGSSKVEGEIKSNKKRFSENSGDNTEVIYCVDCDKYLSEIKDKEFLEKAERHCREHGYYFVWFCRDIEEVFLGDSVEKHQKKNEAARFRKNHLVNSINPNALTSSQYSSHKTNLFQILDQCLERSNS